MNDLNPIGILQNKAKDPSLTSGAVATLSAAAKYLEESNARNLADSRLTVVSEFITEDRHTSRSLHRRERAKNEAAGRVRNILRRRGPVPIEVN